MFWVFAKSLTEDQKGLNSNWKQIKCISRSWNHKNYKHWTHLLYYTSSLLALHLCILIFKLHLFLENGFGVRACVCTSYQFLSSIKCLFEKGWLVKIGYIISKLFEALSKGCTTQSIPSSRQIYKNNNSCLPSWGAFQIRCHYLVNIGAWGICGNNQSTCNINQHLSSVQVPKLYFLIP